MKRAEVSNIEEFVFDISKIYSEENNTIKYLFFRGVSGCFSLLPKVFRTLSLNEEEIILDYKHYHHVSNITIHLTL
ncbi:MAG: hypothetical protein N2449_01660 [Bacteroidales bacterium]|nr:hypothetical protein [Bacteroidales bacterium]